MPANDYQVVNVPVTPGMREDIHRHAGAPPGTLRYAQNVRWGALGAAERRNGTTEIPTTVGGGSQYPLSSATFPVELLTSADETIAGKDGVAYALRPADGGWRFAGRYSSAEPRPGRVDLNRVQNGQITTDSQGTAAISTAGNRLFAYSIASGADQVCIFTLQDANGNTIESETLPNARRCRAVAAGTDLFLVVQRYASNEIDVYRSAAGGALTLLGAAVATLDAAADSWDISAWTSTHWVLASLDSSSTTVTVRRMSGATPAASTTQSASMRSTSRITIFADTDHVWLGWNDNTVSNFARITCWNWTGAAFSATFSANSIDAWTATTEQGTPPIIGTGPSATQVRVVHCIHNQGGHATPDAYTWMSSLVATTGVVSNQTTQYHGIPASKPFGPEGQYIWADLQVRRTPGGVAEAPIVRALMRCRDYSASGDFKYVVDLVGYKQTEASFVFTPLFDGAADWWWMPPVTPTGTYFSVLPINTIGSAFSSATAGLSRYFSFREFAVNATLERRDSATAAGSLNVAGQPCAVLRGANVRELSTGVEVNTDGVELGFHRGPVIRSLTASNGAGALTNNGVYSYVCVYKFVDAAGRVHRSPPSAPAQVTLGAADDTVAVAVATCEMQRALCTISSVIETYRTEDGGTTYHLIDDTTGNDPTVLSVTGTDLLADSAITSSRILYTALQVPNDMAPACRWMRASETRLWAAGLWDPTLIQASKIIVPEEPPLWSDLDTFKVRIPKPCTGLAFQDGVLLAFTATDVYAIGTDGGPGNDGLDSFADARLVCPGVGCEDARSIVETPVGVIFRSRRGFEIMPRGLGAVQPLPGIETQLETYTEVVSSTLHVDERATTAQFVMRSAADATIVLVFDLDRQAWSVDTYPVDLAQITTGVDGRLVMASDDSSVSPAFLAESAAAFDDDAVFYQAKLTYHDIYPFGVFKRGSFKNVLARVDAQGTCVLNVDVGVDGATARTVTSTFSGATTFETYRGQTPAATSPSGTSVQLSTYDTASGDAASGVTFYGLALVVQDQDSAVFIDAANQQ